MRKAIIIIGLVLLMAGLAIGQTVHYANQTTIAWDAVTKYEDGTPITGTVSYEVYLKDGAQTLIAETTLTQYTITLNDYLIHDVGVRASIMLNGVRYFSEVTWSAVDGKPAPFVLQRYPAPAKVQNLRVE